MLSELIVGLFLSRSRGIFPAQPESSAGSFLKYEHKTGRVLRLGRLKNTSD
jgi:hypothetical protein